MNRTRSCPFLSRFTRRKLAIPPCIEPTQGRHPSGDTVVPMKFFTKRAISSLSCGIPSTAGYLRAQPALRAAISASAPMREGSSPGTPISIWINSTPVLFSRLLARRTSSRIVARVRSVIPKSAISSRTTDSAINILFSPAILTNNYLISPRVLERNSYTTILDNIFSLVKPKRALERSLYLVKVRILSISLIHKAFFQIPLQGLPSKLYLVQRSRLFSVTRR